MTVMQMALVRDCLAGTGREELRAACSRPCWTVTKSEYYAGYFVLDSGESSAAPSWKMQVGNKSGQMELMGLVRSISQRRACTVPRPAAILHPWQADPPPPVQYNYRRVAPPPQEPACPRRLGDNSTQRTGLD